MAQNIYHAHECCWWGTWTKQRRKPPFYTTWWQLWQLKSWGLETSRSLAHSHVWTLGWEDWTSAVLQVSSSLCSLKVVLSMEYIQTCRKLSVESKGMTMPVKNYVFPWGWLCLWGVLKRELLLHVNGVDLKHKENRQGLLKNVFLNKWSAWSMTTHHDILAS